MSDGPPNITSFVERSTRFYDTTASTTTTTPTTTTAAAVTAATTKTTATTTTTTTSILYHRGSFLQGFLSALSLVFLSEFGDRTFFIAAILSINHSRLAVFVATLMALVVNSLLACLFGALASKVPNIYIHYISIVLFLAFGLKTMYEAYYMSPENEHYHAAREVYSPRESNGPTRTDNNHASAFMSKFRLACCSGLSSSFLISTFLIILVAELGDRSQLSVLVLAAKQNIYGVELGTLMAQFLCTLIAVLSGRLVGEKVSVRLVTFIAGIVFLVFALASLISGVPDEQLEKSG